MKELIRTNDPLVLSFATSLLNDAGIRSLVSDQSMSGLEGSLGLLPRRLLVESELAGEARLLLVDAGLGAELRTEK